MTAGFRRLALAIASVLALAACGNVQIEPPHKDSALYGTPPWTP